MRRGSRGDCPAVAHRPRGERPPDPALLRASLLRPSLDRSDPEGEIATTVARVSNWGRRGVHDVRGTITFLTVAKRGRGCGAGTARPSRAVVALLPSRPHIMWPRHLRVSHPAHPRPHSA